MRKVVFGVLAVFFLSFAVFAQNKMTISEFSEYANGSGQSIVIKDVLSKENQEKLLRAVSELDAPVSLNLSECTFSEEADIDFFHIRNIEKCILPSGVKKIVNFDCRELKEIVLPLGLETICYNAFFESGLVSVEIPKSVTYIGSCAFGDCDSLKYIKIDVDANTENWSIAWNAWNNAQVVSDGTPISEKEPDIKNENIIKFDHKNYHLFSDINFVIDLKEAPKKSTDAELIFYDSHNLNSRLGSLKIKLKKNKTSYKFDEVSTQGMIIERTKLFDAIWDECEDYWVKMNCVLELSDGSILPLNGSARLYLVSF